FGAPDRDRTCNPQLRRLVLYPVELRALLRRTLPPHAHRCTRFQTGRGGEIRTPDILVPNQARYQATLHPERAASLSAQRWNGQLKRAFGGALARRFRATAAVPAERRIRRPR